MVMFSTWAVVTRARHHVREGLGHARRFEGKVLLIQDRETVERRV
jgi:hypothetical protein